MRMGYSGKFLAVLGVVATLGGCTTMQSQPVYGTPQQGGFAQPQQQAPFPYAQPQGQQQMPQQMPFAQQGQNPYAQQSFNAPAPSTVEELNDPLMGEMGALRDRVTRVERALIRLDRRVQLLERNELGRMTGDQTSMAPASQNAPLQSTEIGRAAPAPQAMSTPRAAQSFAMKASPYGQVRPVAYPQAQSQGITSTLQAAPRPAARQMAAQQQSAFQGLPSLADDTEKQAQRGDIAIWTVSYSGGKVWPERQELAASRDVVEALRSGQPVAIFARGQRPNSKEFRDRVQALSRYLSKVANMEQVPISTLPADHLAADTIEIVTTR